MGMRRLRKRHLVRLAVYVGLIIASVLTLIPIAYMVVSSLKTNLEVLRVPFNWVPKELHFENYTIPLREKPFARYFWNSFVVAAFVTTGQIVTSSLAGYSLAKFDYPGRNLIFYTILSQLMIPFPVIMVALFLIIRSLGWINSYMGLIMPVAAHAFGIFLMRQFIAEVPDSLIEAARIDGASELSIFWNVVLPLSKAGVIALAVFCFTGNWNEFAWPLLIINTEEMYTLPIALAFFEGMYTTNYPQLMAAAFVATIPTIIIFLLLQQHLTRGIVMSGIKG